MKLFEDKKLKKLMEDLIYYCQKQNYPAAVSIKEEGNDGGFVISAYGSADELAKCVTHFCCKMDEKCGDDYAFTTAIIGCLELAKGADVEDVMARHTETAKEKVTQAKLAKAAEKLQQMISKDKKYLH